MWRRRTTALTIAMLIAVAACSSGGTDNGPPSPTGDQTVGEAGTNTELDPDFDVSSLPDDFPTQLIPRALTAGMYVELGTVRNVNFESSDSFDDVVSQITAKLGDEPTLVEGEERLASWTVGIWLVSVIDTTPTTVGFATTE